MCNLISMFSCLFLKSFKTCLCVNEDMDRLDMVFTYGYKFDLKLSVHEVVEF